jgi:hypothetical protein
MTDIRNALDNLATAIERVDNKPTPAPTINDRSLSGNKIHGGIITKFASAGIKDNATKGILVVNDDGIKVSVAKIGIIDNDLTIKGALNVDGEIFAKKLHVDEVTEDVRNERSSPLEFKASNGEIYNKGLLWSGQGATRQFVMQGNPDRIWSSETIDLHRDKDYRIGNESVISRDALGTGIVNSNLKKVGTLNSLRIEGNLNVDEFFRYNADSQQLMLGAEEANGMFTMESWDHQFIIDPSEDNQWKLGTWTTSALHIVTDDTVRLTVGANGNITVNSKTSFVGKVGIGVKNFGDDVDLTVAGPVRLEGKKFQVSNGTPTSGSYQKGDIVWNEDPKPTGFVGWVCVREGTPGEWKKFGQIES